MRNLFFKNLSYFLILCLFIPTISFCLETVVVSGNKTEKKDWYRECMGYAEQEYNSTSAMAGGFASGFLLGLIGTGLGYLIVTNLDPDVPYHITKDLNGEDRMACIRGYKKVIKKKKGNSFLVGGGAGTLLAVIVVTATFSYY